MTKDELMDKIIFDPIDNVPAGKASIKLVSMSNLGN